MVGRLCRSTSALIVFASLVSANPDVLRAQCFPVQPIACCRCRAAYGNRCCRVRRPCCARCAGRRACCAASPGIAYTVSQPWPIPAAVAYPVSPPQGQAPESGPQVVVPPDHADSFEAPGEPSSAPDALYAPTHDDSDEQAGRARDLEDELARVDEELARLRNLNEEMRDRIADLKQLQHRREETPWRPAPAVSEQLGQLAERHPESYQYDPTSGISTFDADVFFDTGKDVLRPEAKQLLEEFAAVFREADTSAVRIQIDGHTDNQPIGQPETLEKHPTNWHLSIHRAESVRRFLAEVGVPLERMHVAGYSMYRPVASNDTAVGRQRNRRVEIRILSPEGEVGMSSRSDELGAGESGDMRPSSGPSVRKASDSEGYASRDLDTSQASFNIPTAARAWRAHNTLRR